MSSWPAISTPIPLLLEQYRFDVAHQLLEQLVELIDLGSELLMATRERSQGVLHSMF